MTITISRRAVTACLAAMLCLCTAVAQKPVQRKPVQKPHTYKAPTSSSPRKDESVKPRPNNTAAVRQLRKLVDETNAACPISLGSVGEMSSLTYANNNVEMTIVLNETYANIAVMRQNPSLIRQNVVNLFKSSDENKMMIRMISAANASFTIKYKGDVSGATTQLRLSNSELRSIASSSEDSQDPVKTLQDNIRVTNLQLPSDLGSGMTMMRMYLSGLYLYVDVELDEELYDIAYMESKASEMKASIKESLGDDPTITFMLGMCIKADRGLAYKYIGDTSGKSFAIKFSVPELRDMVGD